MSLKTARPREEHRELARRVIRAGIDGQTTIVDARLADALRSVLCGLDMFDRQALLVAHDLPDDHPRRAVGERLLAQWLAAAADDGDQSRARRRA